MTVSASTIKRLFAVAGNTCAFPRCESRLTKLGHVVGEICHIRARSVGGPRFEAAYLDPDVYENLILLCAEHHKIIDADPATYPIGLLEEWKRSHEERFEQPSDDALKSLTVQVNLDSIITSVNQQGGQTAQHITNVYHPPPASEPVPTLTPVVEAQRTGVDSSASIDLYDFRLSLRNDGSSTVRHYRIEIEVPEEFVPRRSGGVDGEVLNHNRGAVRFFRRTEKAHPGIAIYPDETSQFLYTLSFEVPVVRYETITEDEKIIVRVFARDELVANVGFRLADYLSEERCDQLWAPGRERPLALKHRTRYPA